MALPSNKIKNIKTPDNTVYEIIPSRLQNNNYEITFSNPLETNATFVVEQTKTFAYSATAINFGAELYFGQVVPSDLKKSWSVDLEVIVGGSVLLISGTNQHIVYPGIRVQLSSNGGCLDSTASTKGANNFDAVVNAFFSAHSDTNTGKSILARFIARSLSSPLFEQAVAEGFGHIVGIGSSSYVGFNATNNLSIQVNVVKTTNCAFNFFDNIVVGYNNTPVYQWNSFSLKGGILIVDYGGEPGVHSRTIDAAASSVSVHNSNNSGGYYYLTTTWGSTDRNNSSLYASNSLYYYNNVLYSELGGFTTGGVNWNGGSITYGSYTLTLPSKNGTLATTNDIKEIAIDDLTNIN